MRLIKVSQDPRDLSWEQALDQLEDDDVLMLAPGFYEIPFGQKLKNIVIKGTGTAADMTVLVGTVILDGRYRIMTDASGQFEFPMVATGGHQLSLRAESVPLPWGPAPTRSDSVEVPLRGVANVRLPVIRVGGGE